VEAGFRAIPADKPTAIAIEEGHGGTPNARFFGRAGLDSFEATVFTLITKDVWSMLMGAWNVHLQTKRLGGSVWAFSLFTVPLFLFFFGVSSPQYISSSSCRTERDAAHQ
jgi:hypothetical protein